MNEKYDELEQQNWKKVKMKLLKSSVELKLMKKESNSKN